MGLHDAVGLAAIPSRSQPFHGKSFSLAVRRNIAETKPDQAAVELLYFSTNVTTAISVGQARGVVLLAAGERGVPSRSYTPQQVKDAVCGHGRAGKEQVARMVARLLGLAGAPPSDHATDALAVAICDLNRAPLARAVAGVRA